MTKELLLGIALACCTLGARAQSDVRVWHALDAAMAAQLERLVDDYNAEQSEFHVELARLPAAGAKGLRRLGLPLNTARPVLYYNRDAFRRAKLNPQAAPKTWYEMAGMLGTLTDAGQPCAYTTAWPAWVMLENSGGAFSRQLMVRWTSMLATWEKSGFFSYSGRADEAEARFAAGECAVLSASADAAPELAKRAHFELGVAPLPRYDDARSAAPLPVAAPAVWVERQSVGITNFFAFLAARAVQAQREREMIEAELEAVWRGQKTAPQALESYARRISP